MKAVIFSSGRLLHPPSLLLPIGRRTARARPTKTLRAVTFLKNVLGFNPHISEFGPVLFWSGLFERQLQMQSLVPSLPLNNLTPLITIFSSVYLSTLTKIIPLRVDKKQYPSGLAKIGPLRIGKIETPPDWDPSGLANERSLRIGTPPVL